jgi:hypothetical protein
MVVHGGDCVLCLHFGCVICSHLSSFYIYYVHCPWFIRIFTIHYYLISFFVEVLNQNSTVYLSAGWTVI